MTSSETPHWAPAGVQCPNPKCLRFVEQRADGSLAPHDRYADGSGSPEGMPHELQPCEGPVVNESMSLQLAEQAAEIERLRVGEEPHDVDPRTVCSTPGQWIYRWNTATAQKRLEVAARIQAQGDAAHACLMQLHAERLKEAEQHIKELRDGAVVKRLAGKLDAIAVLAYRSDLEPNGLAEKIVAIIEGRG